MTAVEHIPLPLGSLYLRRYAGDGITIGIPAVWAIRVDAIGRRDVTLLAINTRDGRRVSARLGINETTPIDGELLVSLRSISTSRSRGILQVDLRIHAPRDVPVYRHEIYDRIIHDLAEQGAS